MAIEAADFSRRTREGVAALLDTVLAARREPERLGYLAAGELTVWARLFDWPRLHSWLRPSLLPMLAGTVLRSDAPSAEKTSLLLGLAGGVLGDVEKTRTPRRATMAGYLGVAGQHLVYSRSLWARGARPTAGDAALRGAVWAAGIGLAAWRNPQLVPAAAIAGAAVSVSSTLADDPALQDGSVSRAGLGHGANLVLISEGLTLLRAAVPAKNDVLGRLVDAGTAATSAIGHVLLVDGLTRR